MYKFKKGDEVQVTAGRDKGRKGKIDKVLIKEDREIGRASCRERV